MSDRCPSLYGPEQAKCSTEADESDRTPRSRAMAHWIATECISRPHRDARRAFLAGWDAALASPMPAPHGEEGHRC